MSFLPLVRKKTYLMFFTRFETPELKNLAGFNHMALGWMVNDEAMFVIEPTLTGASIDVIPVDEMLKLENYKNPVEVLIVDVKVTPKQKLFKEGFQTCASMVQYLAGIDLKVKLVQTLYDKLTQKDEMYLMRHGIRRVIKWESKPQYLQDQLYSEQELPHTEQ